MSANSKIVRVDLDGLNGAGLAPCRLIDPADLLSAGVPSETLGTFESQSGANVQIGVWTCSPCVERVDSYAVSEFCVVGAGRLRLTDDTGHSEVFSQGDAFILYKGFHGRFEVEEDLVKYYASFETPD